MLSIETRPLRMLLGKGLPGATPALPPSIFCEKSGAHSAYVPAMQFETFSSSSAPSAEPGVLEPGGLSGWCESAGCPPFEAAVPHRAETCRLPPVTVRLERLTVRTARVFPVQAGA